MVKNWAEWASGHRQLTTIGLSGSLRRKPIPTVVLFGYHRHEFEGYLGYVGSMVWTIAIAALTISLAPVPAISHSLALESGPLGLLVEPTRPTSSPHFSPPCGRHGGQMAER